jgi:hypothetical protein
MGNNSRTSSPLDTTRRRGRKKKGRPSLLDLQKRSLRLQKQQEEQDSLKRKRRNTNPNPSNSNPYLRFPNSASGRRSTRRKPNPSTSDQDEDDDDEENTSRKEKKLRHVLDAASNSPDRVRTTISQLVLCRLVLNSRRVSILAPCIPMI